MITEKEFTNDDVVLITGVSGRIGRNLVNQLGKNCIIVGFDLQKKQFVSSAKFSKKIAQKKKKSKQEACWPIELR